VPILHVLASPRATANIAASAALMPAILWKSRAIAAMRIAEWQRLGCRFAPHSYSWRNKNSWKGRENEKSTSTVAVGDTPRLQN